MKITKLTTFVVPPRWLFLKVETDEGVTGWGEPVVEGRAETVAACVAELADYLIGKDPGAIEDHWTVLYRGGFYRGGAVHMSALAGIDQALWDIKGKALNQPVYELLGGRARDYVECYRSFGALRPGQARAGATDDGRRLPSHTLHTVPTDKPEFDARRALDALVAIATELREGVGRDGDFIIDAHTLQFRRGREAVRSRGERKRAVDDRRETQ
jgi:galactonate dehydratase